MSVECVVLDMKTAVKKRLQKAADDNGWGTSNTGRIRFEKDGYELYFHVDGVFEVTIRDPETRERKMVYKYGREDTESPLYVATLLYILENVETVVSECLSDRGEL